MLVNLDDPPGVSMIETQSVERRVAGPDPAPIEVVSDDQRGTKPLSECGQAAHSPGGGRPVRLPFVRSVLQWCFMLGGVATLLGAVGCGSTSPGGASPGAPTSPAAQSGSRKGGVLRVAQQHGEPANLDPAMYLGGWMYTGPGAIYARLL